MTRFSRYLCFEIPPALYVLAMGKNKGVCAAKNAGVAAARGEWIIFLDSYDELIGGGFAQIEKVLYEYKDTYSAFFNTCDDGVNHIPSSSEELILLTFNPLIIHGTNGRDAVPVIKAKLKKKYPFNETIRGYEGLAYLGIVSETKVIPYSKLPIIKVHTEHSDRLSSSVGISERWGDIALGHRIVLKKYWFAMSLLARLIMLPRLIKAEFLSYRHQKK